MTQGPVISGTPERGVNAVTTWLIVVIAMTVAMVLIGGVTRLTQSGLSMVDWRPIMGILPPLREAEWEAAFTAYKAYPEYQKLNYGMTLAEFKGIYLMEYAHRVWGRLIGLAYGVPFLWFLVSGAVRGRFALNLAGILILGAAQGVLGWVMVKSGLVDVPSVSPYRLAAHLSLAVLIAGLLLCIVLGRHLRPQPMAARAELRAPAWTTLALASLTLVTGAFVAGLDAGLTYNTFPLMDGSLIPDGVMMIEPAWRNFFENVATVQFEHRALAMATVAAALWLWWRGLRTDPAPRARRAIRAVAVMALIQPALGITTLLLAVPVPLAAAHQGGALVLIGLLTWLLHELREPGPP